MNYQNEFEELPQGGGFLANIGPKAAFFIVLIALSFMIGVVWKLYTGAGNGAPQDVPIVRADDQPFKIVPEDPGGMEIRHKDSTLFSAIKKDREDAPKIENLLADDDNEEPMPRSQLFAGLNTASNPEVERKDDPTPLDQPTDAQPMIVTAPEKVEPAEGQPAAEEPVSEPPQAELEVEEEPEVKPVEKSVPEPEETLAAVEPVKVPAPAPVERRTESMPVMSDKKTSGEYYIQLASTKDKASAESEWKKLANKYNITDMPHRIETANLGAKGIYYRIQAGPVSRDTAETKCAAIKRINPNGCLVKK